jgi:threonine aldolase
MTIDLRSDTVTRPTPGMLDAMFQAKVGDDVFSDDPTINALEEKCARLLGMEAAVYCPSGTMTNQIGLNILMQPGDEVICYRGSHVYRYEGGGIARNIGASVRLLESDRGRISIEEIGANINPADDVHYALSKVVSLENTVVREAGSYYTLDQIAAISKFSRTKGLSMHLDGARLFNALTETGEQPVEFGKYFDTISICLSKGLGAPVGSILACRKDLEYKARRVRKAFGGGMRQAGFLAAAGIYALDHNIKRLSDDHHRAKQLGKTIAHQPYVKSMMPVDTNIVIFELTPDVTQQQFLAKAEEFQVKALTFNKTQIRLVTHLDFDDRMLDRAIDVFSKIRF